jgi:uncharacterized protein (TIGR03032 family)
MSGPSSDELWEHHHGQWRSPEQVLSHWIDGHDLDPSIVRGRARGAFWEILADRGLTLLVTREYEHLVVALSTQAGRPRVSWMTLPHPSGIAVDASRGVVHVASTRNPNQILELAPATGELDRADAEPADLAGAPLVPLRSRYLPGATYIHDLALIAGDLHVDAVGMNAIGRIDEAGRFVAVWWPLAVDDDGRLDSSRNYLQLNSIAAGPDLAGSYFTASSDRRSRRRPGHLDYAVDGRGVLFSGATRDVAARGLTRPHSARLHAGRVWLDNSGYGELGTAAGGGYDPVARLPGWTRGLALAGDIAFVGTSRVIPRFSRYAPGLDSDRSECAIHIVDLARGESIASLVWPAGNQIFAVEAVPATFSLGFATRLGDRAAGSRLRSLYYRFARQPQGKVP